MGHAVQQLLQRRLLQQQLLLRHLLLPSAEHLLPLLPLLQLLQLLSLQQQHLLLVGGAGM